MTVAPGEKTSGAVGGNSLDRENGRFAELGWAKPFPTSRTAPRDVSWTRGNLLGVNISGGESGQALTAWLSYRRQPRRRC
ncbi:hypothetical protein [Streptomyces sp. NPDC059533]|uniref:hypothetical protein n=1 Tax=unclassified Streptomyces TaxID=2593676 RepID=UPI0036848A3A